MIGVWIARYRNDQSMTRAHLVESEIAGREVTRCGRQLPPLLGTEVREAAGVAACKRCGPRAG